MYIGGPSGKHYFSYHEHLISSLKAGSYGGYMAINASGEKGCEWEPYLLPTSLSDIVFL